MVVIDQGIMIEADVFLSDDRIPIDVEDYIGMEQERLQEQYKIAGAAAGEVSMSRAVLVDSEITDLHSSRVSRLEARFGHGF